MPPDDNSITQGEAPLSIVLTNSTPENGGTGPRPVEFGSEDFVEPVKRRLGDYLNRVIRDGGSPYSPSTSPNNSSPNEQEDSFQNELSVGLGAVAVRQFNRLSNSGLLGSEFNINKTTHDDPTKVSRVDLYEDINLRGGAAELPKAVARLGSANNRFSGENPYIDNTLESGGSPKESNSGTKDWIPQQRFGTHTPKTWPIPDGLNNKPVTVKNLKDLGTQILLEASGEAISSRNSSKIGDTTEALIGVTTVPGAARIGGRVNYSRFSAGNIIGNINPDFSPPKISDLAQDGPEKMSYGSPYNPLVPFAGINTSSSQVAGSLLVLTVTGMITALARVVKNSEAVRLDDKTGNRLGSYLGTARTGLGASGTRSSIHSTTSFLLLHETSHEYDLCIQKGIESFFDLSGGTPGFGSITTMESVGFYSTLLRSLIRDTSDVMVGSVAAFAPNFSIRGSLEVGANASGDSRGSLGDGINAITGFLDQMRNSKLLRFMDILARIGDLTLSIEEDNLEQGQSVQDVVNDVVTDSDYIEAFGSNINVGALHLRNRLSDRINGSRARSSTIASNTVLSMYSIPEEYTRAEKDYFGNTQTSAILKGSNLYFKSTNESKRLTPEQVEMYEDEMEAYYVPFYFHDLRTNEMVGFHAFIETISDGYTADYAEGGGMGRIGQTYSYKNTNRAISLSFHMISTNHDDFDEMWLKVNKLVTMLYPQYTEGRTVTNPETGHKFVQPFSQLIGASPMIRLRVGDLIKTNFSELDLARLFGAGTKNFVINSEAQEQNVANEAKVVETYNAILEQQRQGIFQANDMVFSSDVFSTVYTSAEPNRRYEVVRAVPATATTNNRNSNGRARTGTTRTQRAPRLAQGQVVVNIPNGHALRILREELTATPGTTTYIVRPEPQILNAAASTEFAITVTAGNVGQVFKLNYEAIERRARAQVSSETPTPAATAGQSNLENVQEFFSPQGDNGNPIIQGFRSTKGQGLAGFIKSLRLDYNDATWETEEFNSKAPMKIKIDIDFAPVHDLNPGIGADGFMTGAPYNIGNIMSMIKRTRQQRRDAKAMTRRSEAVPQRNPR